MSNPHSNDSQKLSYLACDYFAGRVDTAPCLNEGLYFCALCGVRYCDSHLCMHLIAQFEHDNYGVAYESTDYSRSESAELHYSSVADSDSASADIEHSISNPHGDYESHRTSIRVFRESAEPVLREVAEMELRSYLARLMSEAKRVQRELERRMIFDAEMNGIKRHVPVLSHNQRELLVGRIKSGELSAKAAAKQAKQQARDEKRQATIKAAVEVLNKAIESGKLTREQAINLTKKASA